MHDITINVNTDIDIDPLEILDNLSDDEICDYVKEHNECEYQNKVIDDLNSYDGLNNLAHNFYHGDFNLKKFLIDFIGKDIVLNLIKE